MPLKNDKKEQKRRTQLTDLRKEEKELSKEEQQKVKGGAQTIGAWLQSGLASPPKP